MGYNEAEFWDMTPRFFVNAMRGYERAERSAWERARMVGYLAMAPHLNPKKKLNPWDVWPLPWDRKLKHEFEPITEEQHAATRERHLRKIQQLKALRNGNNSKS